MNIKLTISSGLLLLALVLGACDGGPTCHDVVTCEPACDITMGQICNEAGTACVDLMTCDPVCDATTEFCNPYTGACEALPATCDPTCGAGEYCDDGTCRETPVCSPACGAMQYCE
ncbi:MAG: hypothetical protein AB7S26_39940 [Sandaracinaceae bacterium]